MGRHFEYVVEKERNYNPWRGVIRFSQCPICYLYTIRSFHNVVSTSVREHVSTQSFFSDCQCF